MAPTDIATTDPTATKISIAVCLPFGMTLNVCLPSLRLVMTAIKAAIAGVVAAVGVTCETCVVTVVTRRFRAAQQIQARMVMRPIHIRWGAIGCRVMLRRARRIDARGQLGIAMVERTGRIRRIQDAGRVPSVEWIKQIIRRRRVQPRCLRRPARSTPRTSVAGTTHAADHHYDSGSDSNS